MNQLLTTTEWGELDYLVLDFPPGTGDIQLTICQVLNVTCIVACLGLFLSFLIRTQARMHALTHSLPHSLARLLVAGRADHCCRHRDHAAKARVC